jgi:hypothetical protein
VGASEDTFALLASKLVEAKTEKARDFLLDLWWQYKTLCTEWDAEQWGFDSKSWMRKERDVMESRIKTSKAFPGTRSARQA